MGKVQGLWGVMGQAWAQGRTGKKGKRARRARGGGQAQGSREAMCWRTSGKWDHFLPLEHPLWVTCCELNGPLLASTLVEVCVILAH